MSNSPFFLKAETYFSLMYRRYLKQMVGWKRAIEVQLNQRCLIEKLQKVDLLYSKKGVLLSVGSCMIISHELH